MVSTRSHMVQRKAEMSVLIAEGRGLHVFHSCPQRWQFRAVGAFASMYLYFAIKSGSRTWMLPMQNVLLKMQQLSDHAGYASYVHLVLWRSLLFGRHVNLCDHYDALLHVFGNKQCTNHILCRSAATIACCCMALAIMTSCTFCNRCPYITNGGRFSHNCDDGLITELVAKLLDIIMAISQLITVELESMHKQTYREPNLLQVAMHQPFLEHWLLLKLIRS